MTSFRLPAQLTEQSQTQNYIYSYKLCIASVLVCFSFTQPLKNGQSVKGILTLSKLMPVYMNVLISNTVKAEDRKFDTNLRPLYHMQYLMIHHFY